MNAPFPRAKSAKPFVTLHAVTRFCQRVLDVSGVRQAPNAALEAEWHCQRLNLTINQVRAMILTSKVCLEFAMGKHHSANDVFCAVFVDGVISTVYSPGQAEANFRDLQVCCKKMRVRSETEMRRDVHRNARRRA